MTTLVTSEDYSDAKLMGYDGPTSTKSSRLVLFAETWGEFTLIGGTATITLNPHEAEYIAKAILAWVEHQKKGEG